jgi:hypothetical protein
VILTERSYVNADRTKVVSEDSPEAAFLLGLPGDEVPDAEAERLGLNKPKPKAKGKDD